jgi:hypothetical protein
VGKIYSYPEGEHLMTMEGIDTARVSWSEENPKVAHQLSRKTFIYRDPKTNEVLRTYNDQPVEHIEYPYQFISYELAGDGLITMVEQGRGEGVQKIGPGESITARRVDDLIMYSAPLFLDFEFPGGRYQAFEHYDFVVNPGSDEVPHCSWVRYGDLPTFAGKGKSIMQMVTWRVDDYAKLPESIRRYLEASAPMWMAPPESISDIRRLQQ